MDSVHNKSTCQKNGCCSFSTEASRVAASESSRRRMQKLAYQLNGNPCSSSAVDSKAPSGFPQYSEADAQSYVRKYGGAWGKDLALRCYTSNLIGKEADLVLHGGGNTSVKLTKRVITGETIDLTAVKGSGYGLDMIPPEGFPQVDTAHCRKLLKLEALSDPQMVNELRTHMVDASSPNPSVETLLHAMLPYKFVDHSHADSIVTIGDLGEQHSTTAIQEAFAPHGIVVGVIPYAMPGIKLAVLCDKHYEKNPNVDCLILLQHGLFTWGRTARESYEMHIKCVEIARKYIVNKCRMKLPALLTPYLPNPQPAYFNRNSLSKPGYVNCLMLSDDFKSCVMNAFRGVFRKRSSRSWILSIRKNPVVEAFIHSSQCEEWSQIGTITPDHVIRTKGCPLVVRGISCFYNVGNSIDNVSRGDMYKALFQFCESKLQEYEESYHAYFLRNNKNGEKIELDPLPRVILIEGMGLVTVGKTLKAARIAADIYEHTVPVILNCMALGGYRPVSESHLFECEYWELEQRKLKIGAKKQGALDGKVAYITGGASGIGLATAELFANAGACIFIADVRKDRVDDEVQRLSKLGFEVAGAQVDVTNSVAVANSVHQASFIFGGIDILVSNAGIVIQAAPGMASCNEDDLSRSMNINFFGHQIVSSSVVQCMLAQGVGGSLLYNVSKAPLNPGPQLGPYVVAKAATLALMRQYAIEYGTNGITSNGVNPDRVRTNLFDMKLVEERAKSRGLTATEYFKSNLLKREVLSVDVARAFLHLAVSEKTTGCIFTVDGGNISASPR